MKRKTMQAILRTSVSVGLILLISFASVGFTYSVHYCHGKQADVAYYPELTGQQASCGCENQASERSSEGTANGTSSLRKDSCCKNLVFNQKIQTISTVLPAINHSLVSFADFDHGQVLSLTGIGSFVESVISIRKIPDRISGKMLVYMLHQLRIPFHSTDC